MALESGTIVEGKVTRITDFGAFVELEGGETGLVHISEVSDNFVRDIRDHLQEQDTVKVKVLSVNGPKIDLSIKQATENYQPRRRASMRNSGDPGFERMMKDFMRTSEEKLGDIKRRSNRRG